MKKLIILSAILLGTGLAAQAGVHVSVGIGFPVPPPVVISRPAPVIVQSAPQVVYGQPACEPAPVYQPNIVYSAPVVVTPAPVCVETRPVYYPAWRGYYGRDWDRRDPYRGHGDYRGYNSYGRGGYYGHR
jgi:hypothetical protein